MTTTTSTTCGAARGLNTKHSATYLGLAEDTLKKLRAAGAGPAYVRVGNRIVYLVEDLDDFLYQHRVSA